MNSSTIRDRILNEVRSDIFEIVDVTIQNDAGLDADEIDIEEFIRVTVYTETGSRDIGDAAITDQARMSTGSSTMRSITIPSGSPSV